jgi:hypothetical protein
MTYPPAIGRGDDPVPLDASIGGLNRRACNIRDRRHCDGRPPGLGTYVRADLGGATHEAEIVQLDDPPPTDAAVGILIAVRRFHLGRAVLLLGS